MYDMRRKIRDMGNYVVPTETLNVVKDDPDDDRTLECAVEARSDFLVTQDKDLLWVATFRDIRILKAADFLQRLLSQREP
jgi:predicted nucleic acid-binding protein